MGLSRSEVITAGNTATAGSGRTIAFIQPLFGDATLSALTDGPSGFPTDAVLSQDVPYAVHCSSVTLDAGSTGSLFVIYA